jgi:phosphoadenosine phosphosulfate reductase
MSNPPVWQPEGVDLRLLQKKVDDGKQIVREAFERFGRENLRVAWTGGKDSTVVLWLIKQVCDETKVPLPKCFNIDEGDMFDEIHVFIDKLTKLWKVDVVHIHNDDVSRAAGGKLGALVKVSALNDRNRREIARLGYEEEEFNYEPESYVGNHLMKTVTMNEYLEREKAAGFFVGVRWDEQEARANEQHFSIRKATEYSPEHWRIHPILHFLERDVWNTMFQYGIPICELYSKGYRSLGARVTTTKIGDKPAWEQDLETTNERGGRRQDKEDLMAKLRQLGYM